MSGKTTPKSPFGLRHYAHPDEFGNWLGYRIVRIDRKRSSVVAELEIRRDHLSPAARVHGGVISAFSDFVCGAAVFSTLKAADLASTVELKVNYFRPIELGDRVTAEVAVVFRGHRLAVVHGYLYRGSSRRDPAAMVTATLNVVEGGFKKGRAGSPKRGARGRTP